MGALHLVGGGGGVGIKLEGASHCRCERHGAGMAGWPLSKWQEFKWRHFGWRPPVPQPWLNHTGVLAEGCECRDCPDRSTPFFKTRVTYRTDGKPLDAPL